MFGNIKRVLVSVLIGGLLLSLCACKEDTDIQSETEQKIKIGMCFDTFVIERWERDRDVFVSTANELGATVDVQNPNGSVEEQIKQLEYFIEQQVDVIVVVPIKSDSLTDVIHKAKSENIKVIAYDRLVRNADIDLYISFDNYVVGSCMAEVLASKLAPGDKVIMLCGPQTDENVALVKEGFKHTIENAGIEIADEVFLDEWKSELAYEYVDNNIDEIRDNIKGIMCGNDNLASQAIFALSENRLAGDILVTGQDADLDACQRIVEGTQTMTVYKHVNLLADQAARSAVDLAEGREIVYDDTIDNGKGEIPYIKLQPETVTADNMDEIIIEPGFHSSAEVYINSGKNN